MLKFVFAYVLATLAVITASELNHCDDLCSRSYPLHTYDKTSHLSSCKHGCRLSIMFGVLYLRESSILGACTKACNAELKADGDKLACKTGCENRKQSFTSSQKLDSFPVELEPDTLMPRMSGMVRNMMHSMLQSIPSIHRAFSELDNMPHFHHHMQHMHHGKGMMMDNSMMGMHEEMKPVMVKDVLLKVFRDGPVIHTDIKTSDGERVHSYHWTNNLNKPSESVHEVHDIANFKIVSGRRHKFSQLPVPFHQKDSLKAVRHHAYDWLECISDKMGIPRVIVACILMLSSVLMIWLCLSAIITSPKRKAKRNRTIDITNDQCVERRLNVRDLILLDSDSLNNKKVGLPVSPGEEMEVELLPPKDDKDAPPPYVGENSKV